VLSDSFSSFETVPLSQVNEQMDRNAISMALCLTLHTLHYASD